VFVNQSRSVLFMGTGKERKDKVSPIQSVNLPRVSSIWFFKDISFIKIGFDNFFFNSIYFLYVFFFWIESIYILKKKKHASPILK
jgi:hypothetical protein